MSTRLLENAWLSSILITSQTVFLPWVLGFRPFCVCVALFWLFFRASQILQKPLADLSSQLGFDIPCKPLINLASIKADGAVVYWTLPDKPKHKSQLKVEIHLNGTIIDQLPWHESAVTISGLQPSSFYVVRIACIQNEFSSKSSAIRFRTKPAISDDFFCNAGDGTDTDHDAVHEPVPHVQPYRGLRDFVPSTLAPTAMSREWSSGLGITRNTNRRPSPAALPTDHASETPLDDADFSTAPDTVQELTEKLEAIRKETEEMERLAREEEDDELRQKEELLRERDGLKAGMNDKDKTSRNMKREINTLERQNTTAQAERVKQERFLQLKHHERQKLKDDMIRWRAESMTMNSDILSARQERTTCVANVANEKMALKERQAEEAEKVRIIDDEVKEKAAEIKRLERTMKSGSPNGSEAEPNLVQQLQSEAEEERKWQALRHALHQQYSYLFKQVEAYKAYHAEQLRGLEALRAERRRQDEMAQYSTSVHDRRPQRADSQRSRNAQNRLSISDSPRLGAFPLHHSPFGAHANPSPFFNIQNGMTLSGPTEDVTMSDEERERLTGGAMMSPNAGASLIPTDLFSNELDTGREDVRPLPGLGALPGLPGLPGLPNVSPFAHQDSTATGPASPTASSSRSPSLFASPQASQQNLYIGSSDHITDADRRSIRSTRSNRAPSGGTTSRFSSILGIKPRNKNPAEDGPVLSKASSMPRQDQGIPGLDSATRKRNSSISGGLLGSQDNEMSASGNSTAAATGRRGFSGFWNRGSAWPTTTFGKKPAPDRPGSTHSTELPRPSSDASRWGAADTWSLTDATAGARGSPLAFGAGWSAPSQQSRVYGSRHPSRRQSVQYASSGPPEDILEDDDTDALDPNETAHLAPIGTKPSKKSLQVDSAAKLNPNAKDFKSFFANMKFGSKDRARDSGESSEKNDFATSAAAGWEHEESPPNSRKSRDTRDTHSMTTEDSSFVESSRNSTDLVRTPSHTNSDVPAPSPSLQRGESFMTRLTRKTSSTNKFSLPSFKRERSRLDPPAVALPLPAADDESMDGMSESVGSLRDVSSSLRIGGERDSKEGSRGSRSWSSAFKLGKKKANENPSLSDRISTASGTEDGDDEDE